MICHFSGLSKLVYNRAWAPPMNIIAKDMMKRGYTITRDSNIMWWREPDGVQEGSVDNADIVIYANFTQDTFQKPGLHVGLQGPEPGYFSIDRVGVWPYLDQTYRDVSKTDALNFDNHDPNFGFDESIGLWKENKVSHYNNINLNPGKNSPLPENVPEDHVLFLISGNNDAWNTERWHRIKKSINTLIAEEIPVVVKYDPKFLLKGDGTIDPKKHMQHEQVLNNLSAFVQVYTNLVSLHDLLPKSRAVILEDTVINLEPLMHYKPIIVLGSNPYSKHIAKELVHEHQLLKHIKDLSWHDKHKQHNWLQWYVMEYLCNDELSVSKRLDKLLKLFDSSN